MTPQPRPALRKADDADIHPALAVVPAMAPTALSGRTSVATEVKPARVEKKSDRKGAKKTKTSKNPDAARPYQGAGKSTTDSIVTSRAKKVELGVKVPKSVRNELRAISKASGSSVDDIVTQVLKGWLGDSRRW